MLNIQKPLHFIHKVYLLDLYDFHKQTTIIYLYSINCFVFAMEAHPVTPEVRTGSLRHFDRFQFSNGEPIIRDSRHCGNDLTFVTTFPSRHVQKSK